MDAVTLYNLFEAALWGGAAVWLACSRRDLRHAAPSLRLFLVVSFALMGVSELIETRTGAPWRPWWLLAWKGACVAGMAGGLWHAVKLQRGRGAN